MRSVTNMFAVGNLNGKGEEQSCLKWTVSDAMLQRRPFQKLHGDEGLGLVTADLVNGADVGMVQGRGGPSLTAKTLERLRVLGEVIGQELQRDIAPELRVFGFVNHSHATAAQLFGNPVVRDGLIDHGGGISGGSMLGRWQIEVKVSVG